MGGTINIIIDKGGKVTMDAQGFTGAACTEATKKLEQALGGKASTTLKTEYYMAEETASQQETLRW